MNTAHDMQMVRSHDQDSFNLAVGEPFFLQEHLHFVTAAAPTGGPYLYPMTRGEPELLYELERRHHGMHVVVTNGAKQAISAALAAYVQVEGYDHATHPVPYWPSYRFLVEKETELGLNPACVPYGSKGVRICTSPNNPDGSQLEDPCEIWDCAYASPVYGFRTAPRQWGVSIHSAAKMLALSGLRVGWAVTADARLAQAITDYVERFTSGVCVTSQRHVAYALKHLRVHDDHAFFDVARAALLDNGRLFNDLLGFAVEEVHGVPNEGTGMFAFFKLKPEFEVRAEAAFKEAKVLVVTGPACGADASWRRMSMGHHESTTRKALQALALSLAR